jgi:hypothetical protein
LFVQKNKEFDMSKKLCWCLVTPEYDPATGGLADYTRLVAAELADVGENVTVLAPDQGESEFKSKFLVKKIMGTFGPIGLWRASRFLSTIPTGRRLIFLQWVPQGFGWKSVNLFLVVWVWWRVVFRRDVFWIMAHEAFLGFEGSFRQKMAAACHRVMVWILLRLASKAYAGNRKWVKLLDFWAPKNLEIRWLPVPSNIPVVREDSAVLEIKNKCSGAKGLVGHFGTYGVLTQKLLMNLLPHFLNRNPDVNLLCLGKNGDKFRENYIKIYPEWRNRVFATGRQSDSCLSIGISACDVMMQPYMGGISTRNGSLMAVLSHGIPCVANRGHVTDPEWDEWGIVDLVEPEDFHGMVEKTKHLLEDPDLRVKRSRQIIDHYDKFFSLKQSVAAFLADK